MPKNHILETTDYVVKNSIFVKINRANVGEFLKNFDYNAVKHWLDAAPFDFSHFTSEQKLHFLFIFNALSFSYWGNPKWTVEYKNKLYDGAWGMMVALGRAIEEGIEILDFAYCSKISKMDFSKILRTNTEIPLFRERWKILNEIGNQMIHRYKGKAALLLEEAEGDARKCLAIILKQFPSFQDVSPYKGQNIYFHKRAQLLVSDIYQIFDGQGLGALKNVDQLTACADYKLPQILRKMDILQYAASLAEKIDHGVEIPHDSEAEVEIRANTIWAVEFIKEEAKKQYPDIMSVEINDHLWLATQEKYSGDKPYHLTRTTAY